MPRTDRPAKAEEANRHSLNHEDGRCRLLARNLPDIAVMLFDRELRYLIAEGSVLQTMGQADIEGRTLREVCDPALYPTLEALYQRALDGVSGEHEAAFGERVIRLRAMPVHDDDGSISAGMVTAQDITEHRRAEQALRTSAARFRGLFEHNNDAVFFVSLDSIIESANPRAATLLGYTLSELTGSRASDHVILPAYLPWTDFEEQIKQDVSIDNFQCQIRRKDQTTFPADVSIAMVHDDQGQATHIQAIVRDISEQQNAAAELAERLHQLTTLREVDAELAERLDPDYVLTMALDSAIRLSGASVGLIALKDDESGLMRVATVIGAYDIQQANRQLDAAGGGIVGRVLRTQEAILVTDVQADPDYIPATQETVEQMTIPLLSNDRLVGIMNLESFRQGRFTQEAFEMVKMVAARMSVAVDNARLHRQVENHLNQLQALYERVHRLEQIKTDMIRIASHDLRNPIWIIIANTEIIQTDPGAFLIPSDLMQSIETISNAAQRMRRLVEDILSLERIEETASQVNKSELDLVALTQQVFDESKALMAQRQRSMELMLPDAPLIVLGDGAHLGEAMTNLISNAIKYTTTKERIVVRVTSDRSRVVFEVEDNGPGIPADQQERLFEPFYRAVATSEIEGSGLGLHLVKNIVERYGGKIQFESVYGEGSRFGFSLPLAHDL